MPFSICETFKKSGDCFWKHVTYYYVIKNHVGHKLAIFNGIPFTLLHLLLTRWWDMRLKHNVAWPWEEEADSRNVCRNEKKYCSCCITMIEIDPILSKNIYNNLENFLFRKLLALSGSQTKIFWKFYSPEDILWLPKILGECQVAPLYLNLFHFIWSLRKQTFNTDNFFTKQVGKDSRHTIYNPYWETILGYTKLINARL